jgi:hypothetical protein
MMVDTFKGIMGTWLSALSTIMLEYLLKFRPGLPKEYVMRDDCQRSYDQFHKENREDHQEIFRRLDELKNIIMQVKK